MSIMEKQRLKEELERLSEERLRHRRNLGSHAAPLRDPERRGAGAFADDDPEMHRQFASGTLDQELIGTFIDD